MFLKQIRTSFLLSKTYTILQNPKYYFQPDTGNASITSRYEAAA